jgi:putative secretion ATPase (PEP-CTERM system associated)
MYEDFYGFQTRPFQLTPDHRFFFESSVHKKAASYLLYGLNQGEGFIVITGEVGAGKTTLIKYLLSTLDPNQYTVAEIVTSQLSATDVLNMVAVAWGLSVSGDKAGTLAAIQQFLYASHQENRRCLLLVDEAQNLPVPALEELRMLSNFQVEGRSPLQSFLIAQPQFRRVLSSKNLEQLRQRVIASYHLGPMSEAETADYIRHRLNRVGWRGDPEFPDDCMAAIYRHTFGIPRRINTLASRLLLFGVLDEMHGFNSKVVDLVADELRRETELVPASAYEASLMESSSAVAGADLALRVDKLEAFCGRLERKAKLGLQLLAEYLAHGTS